MDNLIQFVPEQLLIVVAALYVLGLFLKNSKVKDYLIPWVLLIVSVIASIAIGGINITSVLEGVICCGVSVLSNQLVKQSTIKKKEDQE